MRTGVFAGRLGGDAESRSTPSGKSVLNFSVAVDAYRGDKKETLWVRCAMWGERGAKVQPYLTKGKQVCVSGDVDLRTWEQNGKSGASLELNVQQVTLMGGGEQTERPAQAKPAAPAASDDFEDDIPF